jgi:hypothetical protein
MSKLHHVLALVALVLAANVAPAATTNTGDSREDPVVGPDATVL